MSGCLHCHWCARRQTAKIRFQFTIAMRYAHGPAGFTRLVHADKHRITLVLITSDKLFHAASFLSVQIARTRLIFPQPAEGRGSVLIQSHARKKFLNLSSSIGYLPKEAAPTPES